MADDKNIEIMLKDVRLSFADHLFTPEEGDVRTKGKHKGKTPHRWSCNFLIPKSNTVLVEAVKQAMRDARDAEWPKDPPKIKADKMCLRDGDEEDWNGYADHFYVSASRTAYGSDGKVPKRPFDIIDNRRDEETNKFVLLEESDGRPYSGCYVNALVRIWAQNDDEFGNRINASIEAVQYKRKGEAFGGGKKVDVNSVFEEEPEEDDDDFGRGSAGGATASKDDQDDGGLI